MKIDELINELEQVKEEHGNLEVVAQRTADEGEYGTAIWYSELESKDLFLNTSKELEIG